MLQFQRPLFPSSRSNHSTAEQLSSHKEQIRELSGELADHSDNPPARGAKVIVWTNYRSVEVRGDQTLTSVYCFQREE